MALNFKNFKREGFEKLKVKASSKRGMKCKWN